MRFLRSLKGARRRTSLLLALVAVAAIGAGVAGQASAGNSGQLATLPIIQGAASGRLQTPNLFAAEPNGSVLIGDRPEGSSSFRLQKFSSTGTLEGSAKILTPGGEKFVAMAVDSSAHRIYLLRTKQESDPETSRAMAEVVVVLSATPNPTTHELEEVGTPLPLPTDEAGAIDNPTEMALDPQNGELEIAGENRARKYVLQRIGTASGTVGPRYAETSGSFGLQGAKGAKGALAIGTDGTSYVVWTNTTFENKAVTLPQNLTTPTPMTGFATSLEQIQISRVAENLFDGTGPQIAISTDGTTLYFKTALSVNQVTGGNILVFAYSLADEHAFAVYGGKNSEGHCTIQGQQAALAPVGDTLLVLDQGNEEVPSPWGVKVMQFGPGGSECPAPSAAFALKSGASTITQVHAGTTVTLDGSSSNPGEFGEAIESLTWKVEGPGPTFEQTVPTTDAASLTLQHPFTEEGSYKVRLAMHLKNQTTKLLPFDARPQTLTVTAPATGQPPTVTELGPNHGAAAGGTSVTIKGTEFTGATAVHFGSAEATNLTVVGSTEITVKAPAGTAGSAVDVTVTTPEGTSPAGAADKYTYDSVLQTLSVTKAGAGSGTVTSAPAGISCGTTCTGSFTQNQSVSLTATPVSGSTFGGWTGACSGTGSCVVVMSAAKSVVATFDAAATTEPPKGTTPVPGPGPAPINPGPVVPIPKTKAQKLAEQRKAALKKCQKLKGKAKVQCVKKAGQIGKPKPKNKKKS